MFSQLDYAYVFRYMGMSNIFLEAWPLVPNAIKSAQSVADGGSQPDSSAENMIKAYIYGAAAVVGVNGVTPGGTSTTGVVFSQPAIRGLLTVEQAIAFQDALIGATEAEGDAKIDSYREIMRLRSEGQRLCDAIATTLGMRCVIKKYFYPNSSPFQMDTMQDLFPYSQYT